MIKKATFAAGCFWAVEYAFAQLAGVNKTLVGYLGAYPRIEIDCRKAEIGTQYRSSIFYHDEQQRHAAENSKEILNKSGQFSLEIATEIVAVSQFYQAEDYHQDYLNKNKRPICSI